MGGGRWDRLRMAVCLAWLMGIGCLAVPPHVVAAERPNIILFLVDDMGPMDTSVPFMTDAEGQPQRYPLNDFYRTPSMERLASQGVRFGSFYAMSVCSPTRTCILTGQNAARHHVTQWISSEENNRGPFGPPNWRWEGVQDSSITLPGLLRSAGYRTIFVGKAHFGPLGEPSEWPDNLGFDINIAGCSWGQPGSYYGEDGYGHLNGNRKRAVPHLEKYHGTDTFLTDALTIEAKQQISQAVDDGIPFFLDLAHYAVHAPFQSDPQFAENYDASGKPKNAQAYATLIEGIDKSLGDLLDHLETLGIAEETLVLFLGDNGSDAPLGPTHEHASSFPLRAKKGTHYEGGMRTPFIAAWAAAAAESPLQRRVPVAAGAIQSQLSTVMDVYPTILAAAGVALPERHAVDGVNLMAQFSGQSNPGRRETFLMHFPHSHRSSYFTVFRDGGWKLIYHFFPEQNPANVRYELFNLVDDPFENRNLAGSKPLKLAGMMQALVAELEAHGAQYPVDEEGNEIRPVMP